MLDENLLITASKAARGITAAQAAVDEAKRLVDEAKAGVETAKNGLSEAKAAYDAAIAEIAGTGLSASKARKAVEDMLRIFADVGIIGASADEAAAPAEPKAPRRKKAEAVTAPVEDATTEGATTEEPAPQVEPETAVTEPAAPEAETVVEESAVEPQAPASAEVPAVEEAVAPVEAEAAPSDVAEIDNGEAIGEIYALIESSTESEDISVSETLITVLNAADWYSREHRNEPLTLDLYREVLNADFVNQAAGSDGLDKEMKVALETVCQLETAESIFDWFLYVLDKLENGSNPSGYAEYLARNAAPVSEPTVEVAAAVEIAATVEEAVEEEVEIEATDFTPDPEDAEDAEDLSDEVSDDVTLAADDGLVGEEVEDIEGINFLEQPAEETAASPAAPAEEASEAAAAPAAESAAPRGFKRPSFLNKKG